MERCVTAGRFNARVIGVDGEGLLIEICGRGREVVYAEGEGEPRGKGVLGVSGQCGEGVEDRMVARRLDDEAYGRQVCRGLDALIQEKSETGERALGVLVREPS
jgi:hypothetical protein